MTPSPASRIVWCLFIITLIPGGKSQGYFDEESKKCIDWTTIPAGYVKSFSCYVRSRDQLEEFLFNTNVPSLLPVPLSDSEDEDWKRAVDLEVDCPGPDSPIQRNNTPNPDLLPRSIPWLHSIVKLRITNCPLSPILSSILSPQPGEKNIDRKLLENVRMLLLIGNGIERIQPGIFLKAPGLPNLSTLQLTGNRLTNLQPGTFEGLFNLSSLTLSENQIGALKPGIFSLNPLLTTIDLAGNQLKKIRPGTFQGLPILSSLSLHDNRIETLEPGIFCENPELENLNLARNRLKNLQLGTFEGLSRLSSLNLEGNQMENLKPGIFSPTPKLKALKLAKNRLNCEWRELDHLFSNLDLLRELDLSENGLKGQLNLSQVIPPQLTKLRMDGNNLTSIVMGCLDSDKNKGWPCTRRLGLTDLSLRSNQLTVLSASTLPSSLVTLDVSGNLIERIEPWTFSHLQVLMTVNLYNNRIATLSPNSLCLPPALPADRIRGWLADFVREDDRFKRKIREREESSNLRFKTKPRILPKKMLWVLAHFELGGNPITALPKQQGHQQGSSAQLILPPWLTSLCQEQESRDVSDDIFIHPCPSRAADRHREDQVRQRVNLDEYAAPLVEMGGLMYMSRLPMINPFGPSQVVWHHSTCKTPIVSRYVA